MTNQYQYFFNRIAGPDPNLRASDADRERVAERLRKSHTEGRLDLGEFQQRLDRCYEAKTFGELRDLVGDLPRQDEQPERHSFGWFGPVRWRLAWLAPILLALIVVSAASGHGHGHGEHFLWLWIPLLFLFWRMSWSRRRRWQTGARRASDEWI